MMPTACDGMKRWTGKKNPVTPVATVGRGIRVNTLSPGPTDTAMFGRFPGEEQGDAVKDILRTNNPSKRIADPLEIAKLAVYLASDDSAYVVGADFLIDGGVAAISAVGG